MTTDQIKQREFNFTEDHFNLLRTLVKKHTGISLSDAKQELVYGRVTRRLRKLGLKGFDQYCLLLETNPDTEMTNFVNAITTNKTEFFRESHHFDFLAKTAIPYLLKTRNLNRRIRIWSAGCSTGQEPFTIAMVLMEAIPAIANWDVRVLATDIDSAVLDICRQGIYSKDLIGGISKTRLKRWFRKGRGDNKGMLQVVPELQALISFKKLNLMDDWPMRGPFDLLFCRNVVIYFDKPTQKQLLDRYSNILADDGYLFIGHSEFLLGISDRYQHLGQTIHKKVA